MTVGSHIGSEKSGHFKMARQRPGSGYEKINDDKAADIDRAPHEQYHTAAARRVARGMPARLKAPRSNGTAHSKAGSNRGSSWGTQRRNSPPSRTHARFG